jgi:hypothetical protein
MATDAEIRGVHRRSTALRKVVVNPMSGVPSGLFSSPIQKPLMCGTLLDPHAANINNRHDTAAVPICLIERSPLAGKTLLSTRKLQLGNAGFR